MIPGFIPVFGFIDDAIILPGLIWLVLRIISPETMADCRDKAEQWLASGNGKPVSKVGAAVIVAFWLAVATWLLAAFGQRWL